MFPFPPLLLSFQVVEAPLPVAFLPAPPPVIGIASVEHLNSELDSFYSDIATIESNQVAVPEGETPPDNAPPTTEIYGAPSSASVEKLHPPPPSMTSADNGAGSAGVSDKVAQKKKSKKVKTSLSDIKQMSHLISKWQKAQQDL